MHTAEQNFAEQNSDRTNARTEVKACLAVAGGCGLIGVMSLAVNWFSAGATQLHGLLIVAAFYLVLAAISALKLLGRSPSRAEQVPSTASGLGHTWSPRGTHLSGSSLGRGVAAEQPVVNAD